MLDTEIHDDRLAEKGLLANERRKGTARDALALVRYEREAPAYAVGLRNVPPGIKRFVKL
jgi:hypothetical protein